MTSARRPLLRAIAAALAVTATGVLAQSDGPAKILVGFPAGGSFDVVARILAEKIKTDLGRTVIVENRTGAGGRIAVDILKSSPPDGSVVMLGPDALTALYPFTFRKLNYDPKRDLVPVTTVAEFAFGFASGSDPKVNNWAEWVDWARKNPSKANYGIPALGAPHHFYGLLIGQQIGVPLQNVPFQGSAPIALALIGGQIASTIDVASSLVENHKAGKIRLLAVSSPQRQPQTPEVPTFTELGFAGISSMGFNALYAPAGTPAAQVNAWNKAVAKALAQPDVKERLYTMGYFPVGQGPEELVERQNGSARKWEPVIKASGFVAD